VLGSALARGALGGGGALGAGFASHAPTASNNRTARALMRSPLRPLGRRRNPRAMQLEALDYVVLVVSDLDRAVAFYTDVLGLPLKHRSGPFAQLSTGQTRLALYERGAMAETLGFDLEPPRPEAAAFEIGFLVPDVDHAFEELCARGAVPVTPPTDRPWGQRTAYVRDPDGHLIELAAPLPRQARQ
jgi:lactoylglutathione lyase